MLPPGSQIGPITPEQRQALIAGSLVAGVYEKTVDRESAYEKLKGRAAASAAARRRRPSRRRGKAGTRAGGAAPPADAGGGMLGGLKDVLFGTHRPARRQARGPGRIGGALGGAQHRLGGGPRDHPRRAGRHPGRQAGAGTGARRSRPSGQPPIKVGGSALPACVECPHGLAEPCGTRGSPGAAEARPAAAAPIKALRRRSAVSPAAAHRSPICRPRRGVCGYVARVELGRVAHSSLGDRRPRLRAR